MSMTGQSSIELKEKISYSPQTGKVFSKRGKFATKALAESYVYSVPGYNAYKWEITPMDVDDFHEVTMESTAGSYSGGSNGTVQNDPNAPLIDKWEISGNSKQIPLMSANVSAVNSLTAADRITIDEYAKGSIAYADLSAASKAIVDLQTAGFDSVQVFPPVLRHTKMTRNDYTVKQSKTNVGKIYTTAQMYSIEGVPATLLVDLPTDSNPSRGDSISVAYGWLKKFPTIEQVADGEWNITQEYDYDLWPTSIFTGV